ncbi:serine/threonine-protein kinase [Microbacterium yannicii]|uniref:serine/threonine-protein kinase n=1 Tax=Microbacterium yannicii TaxID=671622 RepID=UPI0002FFE014|nr:serine/threonine-protein kinase [Microbacterium yannicii]
MSQREEIPTMALLDGRYQLLDCIGEGGMARVYRADDLLLGRTVAIKMMRTDADLLASPARARTEMTVLASLNHPSLVKLLDARLSPGGPGYLVMEYVDGQTLSDRLDRGCLSPAEAAHLASELAAALHAVHAAGVVHRDVKPSNILLARAALPSRPFHAKLTDFGVAYLADSTHLTTPGTVVGTAAFLAPEQVRGEAATPASDIYALGLVLLEALTGERAFPQASGIGAVMARLVESPAIPEGLMPQWVDLLTRMTALDPGVRPSAFEVAARTQTLPADTLLSLSTAPLGVSAPVPPPLPAPTPAAAAVGAAGEGETEAWPVTRRALRPVGHRARSKRKPGWIAAGALVGSAAAVAVALQFGVWSGGASVQPPAVVATVPEVTEQSAVPVAVVAEVPADDGTTPVTPVISTQTDDPAQPIDRVENGSAVAEEAAERAEEAAKQAEKAERQAAQAEKAEQQAAQAEQKAAEEGRTRAEEARKHAEQMQQKNARNERAQEKNAPVGETAAETVGAGSADG